MICVFFVTPDLCSGVTKKRILSTFLIRFFISPPKPLLPYLNYICSCFDRFPAQHEIKSQCDEGNAQYLSHVDGHGILEIHLTLFEELDEEAERKYQGNAEPEISAQLRRTTNPA